MTDFIEVIKIGGPSTAVAAVILWYWDKSSKRMINLLENHLDHLNQTMNKNTVVLQKLSTLIDRLLKSKK